MNTGCLFKMWFSKCGLRPAASPGNLLEMQISRLYLKPLCVCVFIFKKVFIYLFIFGCTGSPFQQTGSFFVAVCRLLQLWHMDERAPEHAGSVVAVQGLRCLGACGILVPHPGIEPSSPALEDGFLSTGPLGKSFLHVGSQLF